VTGLAGASFIQAAERGPFAIVTGGERWTRMLMRLAKDLGHDQLLRHIETVAPSGAALQAEPETAMMCLAAACLQAARTGVESIILGGAGLAGYAPGLQAHCPLPLIDSATAGLDILLGNLAPAAAQDVNKFHAHWTNMPPAFGRS
jgi:Asp/Glu/hydantoin racemase